MAGKKALLAGFGGERLPDWLDGYQAITLDVDPCCNPDIVADVRHMGEIGLYDVVYCSHVLEHVQPDEVQQVLSEIRRVLIDGGVALLFVPDAQDVEMSEAVLYESPAGPITGIDLFMGYRPFLEEKPYMRHHCAFTEQTLAGEMVKAGFTRVFTKRLPYYNLMAGGVK